VLKLFFRFCFSPQNQGELFEAQFNTTQANGGNRGNLQLNPVKMILVVSDTQGTN
jgi:hypothetical protein